MNVLFIHQNFPGQYKSLAPAIVALGHRVVAIAMHQNQLIEGVELHLYKPKRGTTPGIHPWVVDYEAKVIRAEACAKVCEDLRRQGFVPDIICVHPGWGEALLLREVWPETPQLHFVEFFYGPEGQDVGFDPEFPSPEFTGRCRLNIKNTNNIMNFYQMNHGISPTAWQKSTVPESFQPSISVIHDGVDTNKLKPDPNAVFLARDDMGRKLNLQRKDKVITFINRNMEPNRGYHSFMRSLPLILARDSGCRVVLIGGDGVSYGAKPKEGTWKEKFRKEVSADLDESRVHFVGKLNYEAFRKAIQVSSAHVYLTYPFVLSWSMLEAMSMGATVIGSRTPPVEEVIQHGKNGWLVDFFDYSDIADRTLDALASPRSDISSAARQTIIERYDLNSVCLVKQIALIEKIANHGDRPVVH